MMKSPLIHKYLKNELPKGFSSNIITYKIILSLILLLFWVQLGFSQTVSIPALQTVNYKYHIRGGLVGINLDASNNPIPNYNEGDLFSYKLDYETADKWNGNVGKQTWARSLQLSAPCNVDTRSYSFTYDPAQRLTSATYEGTGNYSIPQIDYDKNSNINRLKRNGWLGGNYGLMDDLNYGYTGNQLTNVTDMVGGNHTVDLDPKLSGNRTFYEDGSLKSDENKAIINIVYDAFTMQPTEITLTSGRWVKMVYLADGTLVKRTYSTGEEWIYTSGMVFLNGQPYTMPIPEGRAVYEAGAWKNEFFITDHLGNVRVTFEDNNGKLLPKNVSDYDPTGVETFNSNVSVGGFKVDLFKFQDKESLSNTFGLGGLHDFGPRMLDKTIGGIWSQPDILSELNDGASPFSYLNGRLLNMIDPTGMMADSSGGTGRVGGAPENSTPNYSKESIPLNVYQVPYGGSGSGNSNSYYMPPTGFNTYPRGGTNAQISRDIRGIDPQTALDGVGMTEIPVVSQIAELVSAGMSFYNRDYWGGAIGLGSMLPLAGKTFEAMKVTRAAAKIGNRAHDALKMKAKAKGWETEARLLGKNGKTYRMDVLTPSGNFIELKPNTVSGRLKGWYQANNYRKQLGIHGKVIYYNTNDYLKEIIK